MNFKTLFKEELHNLYSDIVVNPCWKYKGKIKYTQAMVNVFDMTYEQYRENLHNIYHKFRTERLKEYELKVNELKSNYYLMKLLG